MNAKQAIDLAKQEFADLFAREAIEEIGLEEIEFNDPEWRITLGFYRSDQARISRYQPRLSTRVYKIITISDEGKLISVKNREPADT